MPSHYLNQCSLLLSEVCGILLRVIFPQVPQLLFCIVSLQIILVKSLPHLPGANELIRCHNSDGQEDGLPYVISSTISHQWQDHMLIIINLQFWFRHGVWKYPDVFHSLFDRTGVLPGLNVNSNWGLPRHCRQLALRHRGWPVLKNSGRTALGYRRRTALGHRGWTAFGHGGWTALGHRGWTALRHRRQPVLWHRRWLSLIQRGGRTYVIVIIILDLLGAQLYVLYTQHDVLLHTGAGRASTARANTPSTLWWHRWDQATTGHQLYHSVQLEEDIPTGPWYPCNHSVYITGLSLTRGCRKEVTAIKWANINPCYAEFILGYLRIFLYFL